MTEEKRKDRIKERIFEYLRNNENRQKHEYYRAQKGVKLWNHKRKQQENIWQV
jgi:hypothetical protein